MRRTAVEVVALVLLAAGGGLGWAQQSTRQNVPLTLEVRTAPPAKSKLEEMLAQALKNNPDIRVAAAKVSEAEEKLNRTRLQVTQKVIALYHARESQQAIIAFQQQKFDRINRLYRQGNKNPGDIAEAGQALTLAKARLAETESEITLLLGNQPTVSVAAARESGVQLKVARLPRLPVTLHTLHGAFEVQMAPAQGNLDVDAPASEKLRRALQKRVTLDLTDKPSPELVKAIQEQVPELPIRVLDSAYASASTSLTVHLKNVPLSAALELLQDSLVSSRIVVRSYGLLITNKDLLPPGAVLLNDFIREAAVTDREKGKPASESGKSPQAK
jgi:hypothetical protein